jgi:hypothetical protein
VSSYRLNVVIGLSPELPSSVNCAMFDRDVGDAGTLNASKDQMTHALSLPGNTERVCLDVIAQSESNDELWYLLLPNDQITNLESCGNIATAIAFIAVENPRSRRRVLSSVLQDRQKVVDALLQLKRGAAPKEIHANAAVLPVRSPHQKVPQRVAARLSKFVHQSSLLVADHGSTMFTAQAGNQYHLRVIVFF